MTLEKEQKKNNLQKVYEVIKTMASKPSGLIGLSILLFHVILAITSPLYVPYDYKAIDPSLMLQAPSSEYWFGTDSLGRDVFTRTILGGRTALTVTFFGSLIALVWGGALGIFCGLVGGKIDDVVISQPIKGTRKRVSSFEEDEVLKKELLHCPKERSENVMIVDLVRNDLSKTAQKSSVKVEELFGIYSFKQVHQMISTITSKLKVEIDPIDVIKTTFPMGSMTGAPKLSAMRLIEKYEFRNRGVYSGSLGYIKPNGDFDFNVIIRSMVYNSTTKYLSYSVGSAITAQANAEEEYQECLLKSQAFFKVLNAT